MNLIRKTLQKSPLLFKQQQTNMFSTTHLLQKEIEVSLRANKVSLNIELPNQESKIIFIDPSFTFAHLKDLIRMEYPTLNINFDFTNTQNLNQQYDNDSKVQKFITDSNAPGVVQIQIDNTNLMLKNTGSYPLNKVVEEVWQEESLQGLHLYKKCVESQISPSHAGVLSHFLKKFLNETSKLGETQQLSENEIDEVFKTCIDDFSDPVKQKMEILYKRRNELQSQLDALQKEKSSIENAAEKRIKLYIKLVLLVSLLHISSFYYMIFHVEWLGWDIIEPITYTVQVFSTLLGIRFYMKYKQDRGFESMQSIWRNKMIMRNRNVRDHYSDILQNIERKQSVIKNVDTQLSIYRNRRNYTEFNK